MTDQARSPTSSLEGCTCSERQFSAFYGNGVPSTSPEHHETETETDASSFLVGNHSAVHEQAHDHSQEHDADESVQEPTEADAQDRIDDLVSEFIMNLSNIRTIVHESAARSTSSNDDHENEAEEHDKNETVSNHSDSTVKSDNSDKSESTTKSAAHSGSVGSHDSVCSGGAIVVPAAEFYTRDFRLDWTYTDLGHIDCQGHDLHIAEAHHPHGQGTRVRTYFDGMVHDILLNNPRRGVGREVAGPLDAEQIQRLEDEIRAIRYARHRHSLLRSERGMREFAGARARAQAANPATNDAARRRQEQYHAHEEPNINPTDLVHIPNGHSIEFRDFVKLAYFVHDRVGFKENGDLEIWMTPEEHHANTISYEMEHGHRNVRGRFRSHSRVTRGRSPIRRERIYMDDHDREYLGGGSHRPHNGESSGTQRFERHIEYPHDHQYGHHHGGEHGHHHGGEHGHDHGHHHGHHHHHE